MMLASSRSADDGGSAPGAGAGAGDSSDRGATLPSLNASTGRPVGSAVPTAGSAALASLSAADFHHDV
jgi:hypothetical protein